jgi:alkane 1-monooxygenase
MNSSFKWSYLLSFLSAGIAAASMFWYGIKAWAFVLYAFALIPTFELFFKGDTTNVSEQEEAELKQRAIFDWLLYAIFYVQWALVGLFIWRVGIDIPLALESGNWSNVLARIFTLGITCGVFGINVAHELGHRKEAIAQFYAQGLLLSSLYMHFTIEHNKGHHTHVGTLADGATARLNEWVYVFWFRSIWYCYSGAWKIESERLQKAGTSFWNPSNKMLRITVIKIMFLTILGVLFGWQVLIAFVAAATVGFLLLETVNYVEHYGLMRALNSKGRPVPVKPVHSWNSNHPVGRGLLFELSRHSDHHYRASRKYQILRSFEDSPLMPTGYPGMILMALVPPLWFGFMNPRVGELKQQHPGLLV